MNKRWGDREACFLCLLFCLFFFCFVLFCFFWWKKFQASFWKTAPAPSPPKFKNILKNKFFFHWVGKEFGSAFLPKERTKKNANANANANANYPIFFCPEEASLLRKLNRAYLFCRRSRLFFFFVFLFCRRSRGEADCFFLCNLPNGRCIFFVFCFCFLFLSAKPRRSRGEADCFFLFL